jgi:signal transduction histidine kinase
MLGNFDQVIHHITSVLDIAKKKKLDKYISDSYTYLAIVYDSQGMFEQSIVYMHLATDLYKRNHLTKDLALAYNNLGYAFKQLNELDSSLVYISKSLELKYALNLKTKIPATLLLLGELLSKKGNKAAIDTLFKAKRLFEEQNSQYDLAFCLNAISDHYLLNNDYDKVLSYSNESLKIAEKLRAKRLIRNAYENLSEAAKHKTDYKSALAFKEFQNKIDDELNAKQAQLEISKYEKNIELKDLLLRERIQSSEIELLSNKTKYLSVIAVLALVLVVYSQLKRRKIKQLNLELRTANEEKNKFIGIVAHDLRSPLQIILAHLEIMELSTKKSVSSKTVSKEVMRMNKMINSLLNISQIEQGLLSLDLQPKNFEEIINDRQYFYVQMCEKKGIHFELECDSNLPLIKLDQLRLIEVLDNLISNAIKYTYRDGVVKVTIKNSIDKIEISVSDNGQGLSEEDLDKLFTGEKLNTTPTGNETSTRFGLISVKKIIEAHHGKINVSSVKGRGLTFTFSLPC